MQHSSAELAKRYAKALFALAQGAKKLDEIEAQLIAVGEAFDASKELQAFIKNPTIPSNQYASATSKVLDSLKLEPSLAAFLGLLAKRRRLVLYGEIIERFKAAMLQHKNQYVVTLTSAKPLQAAQRKAIEKSLKAANGGEAIVQSQVDGKILGGVIITMGSRMIDCSLQGQLDQIKFQSKKAIAKC